MYLLLFLSGTRLDELLTYKLSSLHWIAIRLDHDPTKRLPVSLTHLCLLMKEASGRCTPFQLWADAATLPPERALLKKQDFTKIAVILLRAKLRGRASPSGNAGLHP